MGFLLLWKSRRYKEYSLCEMILYLIYVQADPHPTNYIRVLLSFEWCRQVWGHGEWDDWEEEWKRLYPLKLSKQKYLKSLEELRQYIPVFLKGIMKAVIPNLKIRFIRFLI